MKKKVYIETTIPSYLVAKPSRDIVLLTHQELTKQWWENYKDNYELFTSQETIDEANSGDPFYAELRNEILEPLQLLDPAIEVEQLANANIRIRLHSLNDSLGRNTPDVCTPEELIPVEEE